MSQLTRPSKVRVRAPRVSFDLEVQSRTIGCDASYQMSTLDISRSGILLEWTRKGLPVPFIVNTILEMTIDPGAQCLNGPIYCLGKVVRRDNATSGDGKEQAQLGIQIVQIDQSDLSTWENCVGELEERFGIEASRKIPVTPDVAA